MTQTLSNLLGSTLLDHGEAPTDRTRPGEGHCVAADSSSMGFCSLLEGSWPFGFSLYPLGRTRNTLRTAVGLVESASPAGRVAAASGIRTLPVDGDDEGYRRIMTTFYLARHGETQWHADHRYAGVSDVGLTRHGLGQAAALGAWAADAGLNAIVSSPLARARRSAAPSVETTGLPLRVDERLIEIDFGVGEGLTPDELAAEYPHEWAAFRKAPASSPLPGGEAGRDGIARALPVFDDLHAEMPDGHVLIVAHATLLRLVLCELSGIDPDGYRDLLPVLGNCTVTTIAYPWASECSIPTRPRTRLLGYDVPPSRAGR